LAENFTLYTEVDPNGHISKTSTDITFTNLDRNEDAYVYDDKDAGHFAGDFEHDIDIEITSNDAGTFFASWSMTNLVDDLNGIRLAGGDALSITYSFPVGKFDIVLREIDSGTMYTDFLETSSYLNIPFYLEIERDESIGTYGTLFCRIYSDSGRTTLIDTLSVALHTSKKDFQYIYGLQSWNSGSAFKVSGISSNLDLQEAIKAFNPKASKIVQSSQKNKVVNRTFKNKIIQKTTKGKVVQ
jgi:hypothetical protein